MNLTMPSESSFTVNNKSVSLPNLISVRAYFAGYVSWASTAEIMNTNSRSASTEVNITI